ncbi:MAG: HAD family hydrolase [Lautropia sp.]
MSSNRFDADPEAAIRALRVHEGPALVDLDETLYLRNSTEDFVGAAWPGPLAFLLIRVLERIAPWRWRGGDAARDAWRVGVLLVLMPWSILTWRRAARRLGTTAANVRLVEALLARRGPTTIVTLGFRPIVRPLVAAMGLSGIPLIAMRWHTFADRRAGKHGVVAARLGEAAVRDALVVTDSLDDKPLLQACAVPMRVTWPGARFHPAFQDLYLPGLYISRVKRPNVNFIYRSIVSDEFSIWVLASLVFASESILHVAGLALLSLSFWAIYECGYVDNDQVGARYERDPKLSAEFFERRVSFPTLQPWMWAGVAGALALLLLRWPDAPAVTDFLVWSAVLVVTFLWFRLYNRLDKMTRIWFFAGLQVLRSMSFVAVVPVTPIGAAALMAHALARWVPYYTYRATGTEYNDDFVSTTRLLFFGLISIGIGSIVGWQPVWTSIEFVILAWFVFKARHELRRMLPEVHLITRGRRLTRAEVAPVVNPGRRNAD